MYSSIWLLSVVFLLFLAPHATLSGQAAARTVDLAMPAAYFTDPAVLVEEEPDASLMALVRRMVEATPRDDTIYLCMFKFNLAGVADALIAADQRGVVVRLIGDYGKTSKETNREIRDHLDGKLHEAFFFRNDLSKKSIIHNKFLLFSGLQTTKGRQRRVVLQTSANFQEDDLIKAQDLVVIADSTLYGGYRDYWLEIRRCGLEDDFESYDFRLTGSAADAYQALFLPFRRGGDKVAEDPVVEVLGAIRDPGAAHLRLAMGKWDEKRDEIIGRLAALASQGAKVEILLNTGNDKELKEKIREVETFEVIKLKKKNINLHTKYILVEGSISGSRQKLVLTGSQNFTNRSLYKNFEVWLKIRDEKVYQQYLTNFGQLKKMGEP